jgi:hypothetical protein
MTATIDQAIEALRQASPQRQSEIADYIIHLAKEDPEDIDPAALPAVIEGMEQARRRQFATDEQVAAAFARFGQ